MRETSGAESIAHSNGKSCDLTPSIDLYFFHRLGKHQSLTADVLGTYIRTKGDSYDDEGTPYAYGVDGDTYSLIGEAIYENRLRPFALTAGVDWNWKYMSNVYSGDAQSENAIHSSGIYGVRAGEGKGCAAELFRRHGTEQPASSPGTERYNFWLPRPKVTLAYSLSDAWQLRYDFELSQHVSQVAIMEGENIGHQAANIQASVGCWLGDFDLRLYVQNPFMRHQTQRAEIVNALVRKQVTYRSRSMGNLVQLCVAWRINRGKEGRNIQQRIKNKERETGILK